MTCALLVVVLAVLPLRQTFPKIYPAFLWKHRGGWVGGLCRASWVGTALMLARHGFTVAWWINLTQRSSTWRGEGEVVVIITLSLPRGIRG